MMNLLSEGILSGIVVETNLSRKLTIDGLTQSYPVYKVRLDALFFNDKNGRIATWISEYKSEHGDDSLSRDDDLEKYNSTLEDFIAKSNPEALKKTQANIKLVDQREPGVILNDGRVIDGNRRLTCLRRLSKENDRFKHFETIILDRSIENSAKQIKMLELSIQHGEESKVDYSPIDRIVGIYSDVIDTQLLTVSEYARSVNETLQDVNRRVEIAHLIVEFLEFINAPLQFHIAREMQIYSPIEALLPILKKCRTNDEKEDIKISVFTNVLMRSEGDMRLYVRSLKNIIGSAYQEAFIEEQRDIAEKVIDNLPPAGEVTDSVIRDVIRADEEIVQRLSVSLEKAQLKVKKTETRNRPIQLVEKATEYLEGVDLNILKKLNDSDVQRLERQLNILKDITEEIRGAINV